MNFVSYRCFAVVLAVVMLSAGISGCRTKPKDGNTGGLVPAPRIVFQPYTRQVSVQAGEGRYPSLFSSASRAIWGESAAKSVAMTMEATPTEGVPSGDSSEGSMSKDEAVKGGSEGSTPKAEGEPKESDGLTAEPRTPALGYPLLITCFLESEFTDMSIAYDAVGLRGVSLYLELPDGTQLLPVQKVLDSDLREVPVGALKRFARKVTLYFPRSTILVDNPAVVPGSRGVRLVLEGHETQFYFEWIATPDTRPTVRKPLLDKKARKKTKAIYREVVSRTKRFSHEVE